MRAINILANQELADLCAEDQLFEAADQNGLGITDALTPGAVLVVPAASLLTRDLSRELVTRFVTNAEVIAAPGQTWVDLALQQLGDESRLFELCDDNAVGITENVVAGTEIKSGLPAADKRKFTKVLQLFKPSSEFFGVDDPAPEGIEFWAIEIDFIVS